MKMRDSQTKSYMINGKFLTQQMTGVQRFSFEIVKAMDAALPEYGLDIDILVPGSYYGKNPFRNIKMIYAGNFSGVFWEQVSYPLYLFFHKKTGINLGNVAPIVKPDIWCVHDMMAIMHPEWFNRLYTWWLRLLFFCIHKSAEEILTVSQTSKKDIMNCYPQIKKEIHVISEGWQHICKTESEEASVLKKYGLRSGEYFFSNFQIAPYKNFRWILEVAKRNPRLRFVITGWNNKKTQYVSIPRQQVPSNVTFLGYVTDQSLTVLLKNCKGFLFPSFYEGFGLPPLEALAMGIRVIVSDIPALHEALGDTVCYIDPYDYEVDLHALMNMPLEDPAKTLSSYSWEKGAGQILEILRERNRHS